MTSLTTKKNERKSVIISATSHYKRCAKSFFIAKRESLFTVNDKRYLNFIATVLITKNLRKVLLQSARSFITKCDDD